MSITLPRASLPAILKLDAATCTAMGLLLLLVGGSLAAATGLPEPLLLWAGAALIPIAAFMLLCSKLTPVPGWAVGIIVLGNLLWAVVSFLLPASGLISPNLYGWGFLVAQALVVALFALGEFDSARGERAVA